MIGKGARFPRSNLRPDCAAHHFDGLYLTIHLALRDSVQTHMKATAPSLKAAASLKLKSEFTLADCSGHGDTIGSPVQNSLKKRDYHIWGYAAGRRQRAL